MIFNSTFTRFVWRIRTGVLLLVACGIASLTAACGGPPVTKDFSALGTATRVEVHDAGVRRLSIVTDPERIKVACDFIKPYEQGWRSPRWQGSAFPLRRFDFWDGDRHLGEFGISLNFLTAGGYQQDAPAEEIAKIAALFELEWPPQE
ncbi:MAG: hypothetical protein ACRD1W_21080 [Vicinamibacterales bacterium]